MWHQLGNCSRRCSTSYIHVVVRARIPETEGQALLMYTLYTAVLGNYSRHRLKHLLLVLYFSLRSRLDSTDYIPVIVLHICNRPRSAHPSRGYRGPLLSRKNHMFGGALNYFGAILVGRIDDSTTQTDIFFIKNNELAWSNGSLRRFKGN